MMSNVFHYSRRNLARWFTLSMGSILVIFATIVSITIARNHLQRFDAELYNKSRVMAAGIRYRLHQGQWRVKLDDVPLLGSNTLPLDGEIAYVRWYSPEGDLSRFVKVKPTSQDPIVPGFMTIEGESQPDSAPVLLRQVTIPVRQDGVLIGYLQIASPLTSVQESISQLHRLLTLGVPLGLGSIALTGWVLGGMAMQPIRNSYERLHRFTAHASHELRTPLAKILNHAQLGSMYPVNSEAETQLRFQTIIKTTKTLSNLVNDLLFLARQEGVLDAQYLQDVDLVAFLETIAQEQKELIPKTELSLQVTSPQATLFVKVEPSLLGQALQNLLNNAYKYTPTGGTVELKLIDLGRSVQIQVIDTGTGIPGEDLPYIFEQFYRSKIHRSYSGVGLGLAIAQQISQAHRGKLTVQSTPEEGSCFCLELPIE